MSSFAYQILKFWIKGALRFYFSKIKVIGLQNIPSNKPVLFVSNHQNALLDALLIVTHNTQKPYFLTRSDVFKSAILKRFFSFLQMIPIYRMRDGKHTLANNEAIFKICSTLLNSNQSLVVFPEANHNLQRRVRPLSKGFTRIIHAALSKNPSLDLILVPVGLNYDKAADFPDSVAVYYGEGIAVQEYYDFDDLLGSTTILKQIVSDRLKKLTVHIESEDYENTIQHLDTLSPDYLNPSETNALLTTLEKSEAAISNSRTTKNSLGKLLFGILNFPMLLLWKYLVLPRVPEDEFRSTFRFMFFLLAYPIFYLMLLLLLSLGFGPLVGSTVTVILFVFNWGFVKLSGRGLNKS